MHASIFIEKMAEKVFCTYCNGWLSILHPSIEITNDAPAIEEELLSNQWTSGQLKDKAKYFSAVAEQIFQICNLVLVLLVVICQIFE